MNRARGAMRGEGKSPPGRRSRLPMLAALIAAATAAFCGCRRELPEPLSPSARVYVDKCGQCHAAYDPRSLTPAMWATQVSLMEGKMMQAGLQPLTAQERNMILDYLEHNASPP